MIDLHTTYNSQSIINIECNLTLCIALLESFENTYSSNFDLPIDVNKKHRVKNKINIIIKRATFSGLFIIPISLYCLVFYTQLRESAPKLHYEIRKISSPLPFIKYANNALTNYTFKGLYLINSHILSIYTYVYFI